MSDAPNEGKTDHNELANEEQLGSQADRYDLEKHRLTFDIELARIQSLKEVQKYCLLGTWLAAIASMIVIILLFGLSVLWDPSGIIDGWQIVSIAGILFICVAIYGAFIFRSSISAAIEEGRLNLSVNSQRGSGSAGDHQQKTG